MNGAHFAVVGIVILHSASAAVPESPEEPFDEVPAEGVQAAHGNHGGPVGLVGELLKTERCAAKPAELLFQQLDAQGTAFCALNGCGVFDPELQGPRQV